MRVKVLRSLCPLGMAYFTGMEADLPDEQATLLAEAGYVEIQTIELAVEKTIETPEAKKRGRPAK